MSHSHTVKSALAYGASRLKSTGRDTYHLDASLLLCHVLDITRAGLFTNSQELISPTSFTAYDELLSKRVEGMPIQYMTHRVEFYSLDFYVDAHVLLPRGDTEILVERVIDIIKSQPIGHMVEIGTGSGCISVAVATNTEVLVTAVDISTQALKVAEKNAVAHGVADQIQFLQSDVFRDIPAELLQNVDLLVSNPPYIETAEIDRLDVSVRGYEPHQALDGGEDGLIFYRRIAGEGFSILQPGGYVCFEIGWNQGQAVMDILQQNGFQNIIIEKDLAGQDRVVCGRKERN